MELESNASTASGPALKTELLRVTLGPSELAKVPFSSPTSGNHRIGPPGIAIIPSGTERRRDRKLQLLFEKGRARDVQPDHATMDLDQRFSVAQVLHKSNRRDLRHRERRCGNQRAGSTRQFGVVDRQRR